MCVCVRVRDIESEIWKFKLIFFASKDRDGDRERENAPVVELEIILIGSLAALTASYRSREQIRPGGKENS